MNDMLEERNISHDLRDASGLTQPIFQNNMYGETFSYNGAHI